MSAQDQDVLFVWPSQASLPSIDPTSLRALALAQLAEHPFQICTHPSSLDANIPRLQAGNQSFTSGHLDTYLTTKFESSKARQAKADELAYVSLAHKLYQLTLHSCFRVGSNWTHMRSLFCAQYSFPSNLLVARQVAHRAQIQLLGSGFEDDIEIPAELQELSDEPSALLNGKEIDDIVKAQLEARLQRRLKAKAAFDKQKVVLTANELYRTFSDKLGDREFFYDEISTLDAHVYAALAPVLQLDLPTSFLRQILSTYPNLLAHTARVQIKLFDVYHPRVVEAPTLSLRSLAPSLDWTGLRSRTGSRLRTEKEKDLSVRRAWYIMGVGSCLAAFVLHQGIVRLPDTDSWKGGDIRAEEADERADS